MDAEVKNLKSWVMSDPPPALSENTLRPLQALVDRLSRDATQFAATYGNHVGDNDNLREVVFAKMRLIEATRHIIQATQNLAYRKFRAKEDLPIFSTLSQLLLNLRTLDTAGHVLRLVFHRTISPGIRPLHVLTLPDEILVSIFSYAKTDSVGEPPSDPNVFSCRPGDVQTIKNCRMTCRRFNSTSSHLLLSKLEIIPSKTSLTRLDEISRHPIISRGIQGLCVRLPLYAADLAANADKFQEAALRLIQQRIRQLDYTKRIWPTYNSSQISSVTQEDLEESYANAFRVLSAWTHHWQHTEEQILNEEARRYVAALHAGHQSYRRSYREQQTCLQGGRLLQTVAEAVTRMPQLKQLHITDYFPSLDPPRVNTYTVCHNHVLKEANHNVANCLPSASRWSEYLKDETRDEASRDIPFSLIQELPVSMSRLGVSLNYLKIDLRWSSNTNLVHCKLDRLQEADLRRAAENLRVFEYAGPAPSPPMETQNFSRYLNAFASGHKLQIVRVRFHFPAVNGANDGLCLVDLAAWTPPSELSNLRLASCAFHLGSLKKYLAQYKPKYIQIHMDEVQLLSGTWAETLDVLREKADAGSLVQYPIGARVDGLEKGKIEGIFSGPDSKATRYIVSDPTKDADLPNPLLPPPAAVENEPE